MPAKDYNNYMNKYMKKRYHTRRCLAICYLGGRCASCGTLNKLEFDHILPEEKEFAIGKLLSGGSDEKLYKELDKCQLLCNNCHKDKSKIQNAHENIEREIVCICGKKFHSTKAYAGHKTWCKE